MQTQFTKYSPDIFGLDRRGKMKTMKFFVIVAIFVLLSFLTGCMKKLATPSDIEVRITTRPARISLSGGTFSAIEYEGTATNTGEGKAPLVKIKITWEEAPGKCKFAAFGEETFKNLRPGETRQLKGTMDIQGLDEVSQNCLSDLGGVPLEELFEMGKTYYTVEVLPQEK